MFQKSLWTHAPAGAPDASRNCVNVNATLLPPVVLCYVHRTKCISVLTYVQGASESLYIHALGGPELLISISIDVNLKIHSYLNISDFTIHSISSWYSVTKRRDNEATNRARDLHDNQ